MKKSKEIIIDNLSKEEFLKKTEAEFVALKKDKKAWAEILEERKLWDTTLMDGLEDE